MTPGCPRGIRHKHLIFGLFLFVPDFLPRGPGEASRCRKAKIAARRVLPLNCRAITLTAGALLKEEKKPSLVGERHLEAISRDNLGEGNCESKFAARQWGVNFCREASRCLAGPSG